MVQGLRKLGLWIRATGEPHWVSPFLCRFRICLVNNNGKAEIEPSSCSWQD